MNKFQKLAQLNKDIELLENAGKFKAAEVLQRKFVREAQLKSAKELMTEVNTLAQNPGPDFDNLVLYVNNMLSSFSYNEDEKEAIKRTILNGQKQRQNMGVFSTTIKPQNQTLSSFETAVPKIKSTNSPATTQAQPVVQDNFQNYYTDQSDTANFSQQQNSNPNAQQESNEQKLYMNSLNDIENAFKQQDRNTGEAIYNQTYNQFQNPKRKQFFGNQIQRLRSKYLKPGNNQGPKQM